MKKASAASRASVGLGLRRQSFGGYFQWVLDAACEAVEWPYQPLGFDSLALRRRSTFSLNANSVGASIATASQVASGLTDTQIEQMPRFDKPGHLLFSGAGLEISIGQTGLRMPEGLGSV